MLVSDSLVLEPKTQKMTVKTYLFSTLLFLGIFGFVSAQESVEENPFNNAIMEQLDLSPEQRAKMTEIKEKYSQKIKTLRSQSAVAGQTITAADLREILANQSEEIKTVLSREQLVTYEELLETRETKKASPVPKRTDGEIID